MSLLETAPRDSAPHVEASQKFFAEEFPDSKPVHSFGYDLAMDEASYTIGVTASDDFSEATVAADIFKNKDEDPYLVFPDFSTRRALFEKGLASALGEFSSTMAEEDEDFEAAGVRLAVVGWELDKAKESDNELMNDVHTNAFPIGVDMEKPVYAQEFHDIATGEGVGVASFYTDDGIEGAPPTWNFIAQVDDK